MSNKPSAGLLVELISQSRLQMAKISYYYIEIQFSLNHICSEIFEILGVDKQMFISCGQDEPYRSSKKAYFSRVIGVYFLSFINKHPALNVFLNAKRKIILKMKMYSTFDFLGPRYHIEMDITLNSKTDIWTFYNLEILTNCGTDLG